MFHSIQTNGKSLQVSLTPYVSECVRHRLECNDASVHGSRTSFEPQMTPVPQAQSRTRSQPGSLLSFEILEKGKNAFAPYHFDRPPASNNRNVTAQPVRAPKDRAPLRLFAVPARPWTEKLS